MDINQDTETADVVVVGARVAGAATAMLLARAGHDVLMIDRVRQPADTLSTHAFARGGIVQLHRWGLLDDLVATGAPPVRQVSFHTTDGVVPRAIAHTAGVDMLLAPRRHILDPFLVDAALEAGARLWEGDTVVEVTRAANGRVDGVRVEGPAGSRTVRARHVVGADGMRSTVARLVGAERVVDRPSPSGTHYLYVHGLDAVGFEFHIGGGGFAGVFPTHGGEACVFLCAPRDWSVGIRGGPDERLAEWFRLVALVSPDLVARISRARVTTPIRGAVGLPNHVLRGAGAGWWLVGDAGYHRDPITGHGMTDALYHAELLADAVDDELSGRRGAAAAAAGFERRRRRALGPIFDLTCELVRYPPTGEFLTLQKRFSQLLEQEALDLEAMGERAWTGRAAVAA